jgi:glycosyltransferase involved in cell wall biosynthesis
MAARKPVVAPDLDPITDVIAHDRTGLIFPAGNFAQMGCLIKRLISDGNLRERLGEAARQEIVQAHTWEKKAERALDELHRGRPKGSRRN